MELRSPSDRLVTLQEKMEEYRDNGVVLGWLIDPIERAVCVYRFGVDVEYHDNPERLSGEPELPGFILELQRLWGQG